MVKKTNDTPQVEQVFRMVIQPVNEFASTEDMLRKVRIMFGSCGLKITEAERIEDAPGQE